MKKALKKLRKLKAELDLLEVILDMPGLQGKGCKAVFEMGFSQYSG